MSTILLPTESRWSVDSGDELHHYFCCDEDLALCGRDISDLPVVHTGEHVCVVCDDLVEAPCPNPNCPDRDQ